MRKSREMKGKTVYERMQLRAYTPLEGKEREDKISRIRALPYDMNFLIPNNIASWSPKFYYFSSIS